MTKPKAPEDLVRPTWQRIIIRGEPTMATMHVRVYPPRQPPKPKSKYGDNLGPGHDRGRRYDTIRACRLHLIDLARVYGYDRVSPGVGQVSITDIFGSDR